MLRQRTQQQQQGEQQLAGLEQQLLVKQLLEGLQAARQPALTCGCRSS
jgi:hypothetical protein